MTELLTPELAPELIARIETVLEEHPIVLFMKGEPDMPMCGFSAKAAAMMNHIGAPYHAINILEDEDLRQGLKVYGDWPTFPQLYVQGELVGGADIMSEMFQSGELADVVNAAAV